MGQMADVSGLRVVTWLDGVLEWRNVQSGRSVPWVRPPLSANNRVQIPRVGPRPPHFGAASDGPAGFGLPPFGVAAEGRSNARRRHTCEQCDSKDGSSPGPPGG